MTETDRKEKVLINCDMGESFGLWSMGNDEQIMPLIHASNIACGAHAGDPSIMAKTVELALKHDVMIGAHPGYSDKQGFGRRSMVMGNTEIRDLLWFQIGALYSITKALGGKLTHIKPHGALYNDMMKNVQLMKCIIGSVSQLNLDLKLVIQSTEHWQLHTDIANGFGVPLWFEGFSDRAYLDNGLLVSRNQTGALLTKDEAISQSQTMLFQKQVNTIGGKILPLRIDTLCIHGDGKDALEIAQALYK